MRRNRSSTIGLATVLYDNFVMPKSQVVAQAQSNRDGSAEKCRATGDSTTTKGLRT